MLYVVIAVVVMSCRACLMFMMLMPVAMSVILVVVVIVMFVAVIMVMIMSMFMLVHIRVFLLPIYFDLDMRTCNAMLYRRLGRYYHTRNSGGVQFC